MFIDVHVLQTVPPSNLNRDDNGSPKSAVYGGVPRARVSSQAWKRATREAFKETLDPATLGVRTKRVVELIVERIGDEVSDAEARGQAAEQVLSAAGIKLDKPKARKKDDTDTEEAGDQAARSKYLLFLSASQIQRLADLAVEAIRTGKPVDKNAARAAGHGANSIDVALFGRMVADASDLNVDAAAQVAHAISVHAVTSEFDYFTAVDDRKPHDTAGADMIGLVEFNSSTLYRYATLNVAMLRENLGDDKATIAATSTFVSAFVTSMPTGKQNTFANRTLPDVVLISVRTDQPVSLVNAFEDPINAVGAARAANAAKALVTRYQALEKSFGNGKTVNFVVTTGDGEGHLEELGEPESLSSAVEKITAVVETALKALR
ncbi:type I-E CRISPR-associated protein Cas7/Cse4/CasC [Nocardia sp. NPDC050435]|uniref:type I-E CRISPR-associated protein Cas7/Cse4/CasC n=1 Tax=Nocardia sp. NPDC050435 TaxID=3155040 RepID=UPI003404DFA8